MNSFHSDEELEYYNQLVEKAKKVKQIAEEFSDEELGRRADAYQEVIDGELEKYNGLIGKEVFAPYGPSSYFIGKIEEIVGFIDEGVMVKVSRQGFSDVEYPLSDLYGKMD